MAQADLNGDGRVDVVLSHIDSIAGTKEERVYLNTGRGFQLSTSIQIPSEVTLSINVQGPGGWPRSSLPDMARFVDFDNDGLVDIVKAGLCLRSAGVNGGCEPGSSPAKWYRNAGAIPDRLERIDSTTGAWTTIEYASPKTAALTIPEGGIYPPASTRLVNRIRSAAGPVPTPAGHDPFAVQEVRLSYENFVRDLVSNEVLGFEKVRADFVNSFDGYEHETVRVTRTHDVRPIVTDASGAPVPVRHALKGRVVSIVTESEGWIATDLEEYAVSALGTGARIRSARSVHGDVSSTGAQAWSAEETQAFDPFGYPTLHASGNYDGVSLGLGAERRTVATEYENRGDAWQLGMVTR